MHPPERRSDHTQAPRITLKQPNRDVSSTKQQSASEKMQKRGERGERLEEGEGEKKREKGGAGLAMASKESEGCTAKPDSRGPGKGKGESQRKWGVTGRDGRASLEEAENNKFSLRGSAYDVPHAFR